MEEATAGFGARLSQLRKARGLSQEKLASAAGCSRESLSQYENNEGSPRAEVLAKLAKELAVSITYLLLGEEEVSTPFTTESILVELERINRRTTELLRRVILYPKETAEIHRELETLEQRAQAIHALIDRPKA